MSANNVYCVMVLTDNYVEGAEVVVSQLRSLDPHHDIICLATRDSLSPSSIATLERIFDRIWFTNTIDAGTSPELSLLNRPELRYATTKLQLWSLPYRRIIYLDADTLPLQTVADLFELPLKNASVIAASPDSSWPDIFNSGVMALQPDPSLIPQLLSKIHTSLDGSDQGVLNQEFEWHRLPFLYNVTVNTAYQYAPAYRRFESQVKILHFVGSQKPWNSAPSDSPEIARWWSARAAVPGNAPQQTALYPSAPAFNEENIIKPPPDQWNAQIHPPFPRSRPEAAQLFETLKNLTIAGIVEDEPKNNAVKHTFPRYGPSTTVLPFETDQVPPERIFH